MEKEIWIGAALNFSGIMQIEQNQILFIGHYSKAPEGGVTFVLSEQMKFSL